MAEQQQLLPWGRFKLVSKDPADERDHLYFYRKTHRIGRNARRSDIILDKLFISSTHCVITFEDADEDASEPTVTIQDLSRNGVYLNEVLVGLNNSAVLENNITVHFTKPGLRTRSITPTVYKFELLQDGLTEENTRLRNARESATYQSAAQAVPTAAHVSVTQPEPPATQPETTATPAQAASSSAASSSTGTSMIRPTQELTGQKRSPDETELEIEATHNLSATGDNGSSALRTTSASSVSSSGSASSSKKKRRAGDVVDAGSGGNDLNTAARIQQANQELRQQLQESTTREVQLSAQLSEAEVEILSLTSQLEKCHEHGKKLKNELDRKQEELDERDQLIAQLKQDKLAREGEFADSVLALESANEKVVAQASAIGDLEKNKKTLGVNLATVTEQLDSSLAKVEALEDKVKALEVEKRQLAVAKLSITRGRESTAQSVQDVQEQKGIMAGKLSDALEIFEAIHQQVLKGRSLGDTPDIAERRRRRVSVDSMLVEHSIEVQRQLTGSLFGSSEQSAPTPDHSSDVNTQDPDEAETMDQDTAAAEAPLPTLSPFLVGGHQVLQLQQQQQRTSQDAVDESETQQPPGTGEGEVRDGTPDPQRGDSEESMVSVRSASKTPPAKPIQVQSTSKKQEEQEEDDDDDDEDVVVVRQVVVDGGDDENTDDEVPDPEDGAAANNEANADTDGKTPAEETKQDDGDDDVVVVVDAPTPAAAVAVTDKVEEQAETVDEKPDGDSVVETAEQEKEEANAGENGDENEEDEDEPPVPARSSTDNQQQHWLPTISHDESLDSQTNASEDAGIFDDETQLSQ